MPNKRNGEMKFCTDLQKWLKYNMKHPCYIEAKVAYDDKPFNLSSGFKEHQLPLLINAKTKPFAYKISDMDRMQKPFDIIFGNKIKTYVAIHWVRRGNKTFYLIDPKKIQELIDGGVKSIDEGICTMIASIEGELK